MNKIFAAIGVLLVLTGAYFTFRSATPLSDEAQITQNLDEAQSALEARSAARVTKFLSKDFQIGDMNRKDFNSALAGAMWQWRDVKLTRTGEKITVSGDGATVTGLFKLRYSSTEGGTMETQAGAYTMHLRKEDGESKVLDVKGDGVRE